VRERGRERDGVGKGGRRGKKKGSREETLLVLVYNPDMKSWINTGFS